MKRFKLLAVICFLHSFFQLVHSQNLDDSKHDPADKLFSFGLIADPQYANAETAGNRYYRNSLKKLENCVDELNTHDLSFTITLGDMIDRDFSGFDKVLPIVEKLHAPVYNVVGNHYFEVEEKYKIKVRSRLNNKKGYFDFMVGDFVFIVLDGSDLSTFGTVKDSKQYVQAAEQLKEIKRQGLNNAYDWNGGIGSKQFRWLEKRLKKANCLKKKLFFSAIGH